MRQWSLPVLGVCAILVLCQLCVRAYLVNSGWTARELTSGFFNDKCHIIPKNMTLCYGIGYDQMRLPNLLNHESVSEAVQQSNIWNLLDKTKCHDDLRIFLCSLYAPVCLKEGRQRQIIKPCRSLCHVVRDNCLPRMRMFGYEWPAIARCDKFPVGSKHICIPARANEDSATRICKACNQAITFENIISSYCMAKVVMKGKMKSHEKDELFYFLNIHKKRRYFRAKGLSSKQKKTILGHLKREEDCTCPKLKNARKHEKFLIMGNRNPQTGYLDVMFLTPWQRRNQHFKRATRAIRKKRELCRKERLIHQHYNLNTRRQRIDYRKKPSIIRRPTIHDPIGLGRGHSSLPLPNFNNELPRPIVRPIMPMPNPLRPTNMVTRGRSNKLKPNRPSNKFKSRGSSKRKNQRENRKGKAKQRGGKKKGVRRRKGPRKGRGRGRGKRKNRKRDGKGKKKKRKRKRNRKMRINIFNRYYSMAS